MVTPSSARRVEPGVGLNPCKGLTSSEDLLVIKLFRGPQAAEAQPGPLYNRTTEVRAPPTLDESSQGLLL